MKKMNRQEWIVLGITAVLVFFVSAKFGIIGFHYPNIIEDQPLNNPVAVDVIEGNKLILSDGRIIEVDTSLSTDITNQLAQSDNMIDVEGQASGEVMIYARQDGWVCGTPWANIICIPLIKDTVYKNRRECIGVGEYIKPQQKAIKE